MPHLSGVYKFGVMMEMNLIPMRKLMRLSPNVIYAMKLMKNNISSMSYFIFMKNNIYALIIISFHLIDDANWFWFIKPFKRLLKFIDFNVVTKEKKKVKE
jgi:hypothetical protein